MKNSDLKNIPDDVLISENRQGDLEAVDLHTGEIITVESDTLPEIIPYTVARGEMVAHLVRSGNTLQKAAELAGLPHENSIYAWRRSSEDFKLKLEQAEQDKAYYYVDKIQEVADKPLIAREDVAGYKYKTDLYEKLAAWKDREKFGTKHVAQTHSGALQLIIKTGIDRSNPDGRSTRTVQSETNSNEEFSGTGREQESLQGPSDRVGDIPDLGEADTGGSSGTRSRSRVDSSENSEADCEGGGQESEASGSYQEESIEEEGEQEEGYEERSFTPNFGKE